MAWLLTRDETFVEYILKNHRLEPLADPIVLDGPIAMALALVDQMHSEGAFVEQADRTDDESHHPCNALVVDPRYIGRFSRFTDKIRMDEPSIVSGIMKNELVHLLIVPRIAECVSKICWHIKNGDLKAHAVPTEAGVVGKAGEMPPSAITDTMTLGNDGMLHQEGGKRQRLVPAFKQVTVPWTQFVKLFPKLGRPPLHKRKRDGVHAAIENLGFEKLDGMRQKTRESAIMDWVSQHTDVTVQDSLVRKVFAEVRKTLTPSIAATKRNL